MQMASPGFIATLFLSLIFFSQSLLAVSMPCSELVPGSVNPAADEHAHHHMDSVAPDSGLSAADAGCCDGGYCSVGGCLTLSTLPGIQSADAQPAKNSVDAAHFHAFESHSPDTLYRPPILR